MKKRVVSIILCIALCILTIPVSAASASASAIQINEKLLALNKAETYALKISGTNNSVNWKSDNESIATVSSKGIVTPVSEGNVNIYGVVGKSTYKCNVTVTNLDKNYLIYEDDNVKMLYKGISNERLCFEFANKTNNEYFIRTKPFNIDGTVYGHYLVDSTFSSGRDRCYFYKPGINDKDKPGIKSSDIKNISGTFTLCYLEHLKKIKDINFSIDLE